MLKSEHRFPPSRTPVRGCVIEADTLALGGIGKAYAICERHLAAMEVKLDAGLFGRYLLGAHLESGLSRLLTAVGRTYSAELGQAIRGEYLAALAGAALPPESPLVRLAEAFAAGGRVGTGLLTQLAPEQAATPLAPLLAQPNVTLLPEPHCALVGGFSRDTWRRCRERLQMQERLCVALVASGASCRSALAAGFKVVAVADKLTAHQDFTGAIHVAGEMTEDIVPAVLDALQLAG
jgi:hypothetical protein